MPSASTDSLFIVASLIVHSAIVVPSVVRSRTLALIVIAATIAAAKTYNCVYKILDLEKIKAELMKEAAKNAERDANVLLSPFNKKVKKLLSIYGSSEPDVMDETAEDSWRRSDGESSLMKKVKQKISADFSYE